jgi:hypothetical protein
MKTGRSGRNEGNGFECVPTCEAKPSLPVYETVVLCDKLDEHDIQRGTTKQAGIQHTIYCSVQSKHMTAAQVR